MGVKDNKFVGQELTRHTLAVRKTEVRKNEPM